MRNSLAESLLAETMKWSPDEVNEEIFLLQAISEFKYNEYHQFTTGVRFLESLVRWLQNFKTIEERKTAYTFVKSNLIFISSDQIAHLINMSFTDKINPILIEKSSKEIDNNPYLVKKISKSDTYKSNLRQTLFIALSDGSKIDILRRVNRLSNEQVLTTYEISPEKASDLINDLNTKYQSAKFSTIFLIDDFTGSGKSYFRSEDEKVSGKIAKFLNRIFIEKNYNNLLNIDRIQINILFYVATEFSLNYLNEQFKNYQRVNNINFDFTIDAVQIIPNKLRDLILNDKNLLILCEKYFDKSVVDSSYRKGDISKPFLGFDGLALPIVFFHNTPNNSLPILWSTGNEEESFVGLFPRITRHRDEH